MSITRGSPRWRVFIGLKDEDGDPKITRYEGEFDDWHHARRRLADSLVRCLNDPCSEVTPVS